ncbi:efflux transporter outer membrane subunit [Novosphingobium rosa]|uniref:efflux transporter outer membrane subunit n=1 Tax=Novosphingobium rosa TaxID=76978 RepID=UPI00082E2923|nr:efflux transporter outer membrane subunit [Novosphingobium rosa]
MALALLLGGCTVGPNFHAPAPPAAFRYAPAELPQQLAAGGQSFEIGGTVDKQWWRLFGSPQLDALEQEALTRNADLAVAKAALDQAREVWLSGRAARYPTVQVAAGGSRSKDSYTLASPLSSNEQSYSLYAGQFNIAYVLDVFGGRRRQIEALGAQAEAQRCQLQATWLALTSNVAGAVLQVASLNAQLSAARANVATLSRALEVTRQMQRLGELSTNEVAAAENALEAAQQAIPPLRKQLAQTKDLLAVYVGRESAEQPTLNLSLADLRLPPRLPVMLPSQLIGHRPDVMLAQANLHVASAQVGVATAARLPSFNLSASLGGISTAVGTLLSSDNAFWSVGGSVGETVFDAGGLRHQQKAAQAAFRQAQAQYRGVVLLALQNTADVLAAIVQDADALDHAAKAAHAAEQSSLLAQAGLAQGEIGALPALAAQSAASQAQLALIQADSARYGDTIALFQALGGGWNGQGGLTAKAEKPGEGANP